MKVYEYISLGLISLILRYDCSVGLSDLLGMSFIKIVAFRPSSEIYVGCSVGVQEGKLHKDKLSRKRDRQLCTVSSASNRCRRKYQVSRNDPHKTNHLQVV
jgi:hypothetical protein